MVMGLVGLDVGTALRSSAGGFIAIFALLFVVPALISLLPTPWNERIGSLTLPITSSLLPGRMPGAWPHPGRLAAARRSGARATRIHRAHAGGGVRRHLPPRPLTVSGLYPPGHVIPCREL
ncbi:hypothetical protein AB0K60_19725 [Thermopolyspora sp. NPDC052614]|uniref:hypothetical protein n=1 Tax=Thermopolyspora sp. NPDC052614 TaxID=3155682 RepID=UPI0034293D10